MTAFLEKNRFWLVALAVLAGGALRLYGLDWGLPFRYHTDENAFINAAAAMSRSGSLNPRWFYHPSLGIYVLCALAKAASLFRDLDLPAVHLLGRLYAAVCGTLSIWAAYLVGKKLYGRATGVLSAVFLAFAVIHIQSSHYFAPDVPLGLYLLFASLFAADIMREGGRKYYVFAGIFCGAAMATKYWAPTVSLIVVAHLIRFFSLDERRYSRIVDLNLVISGLVSFLTFFLCSPYVILDIGEAYPRIVRWAAITTGRIPQVWTLHFDGTTPYVFHLVKLLPWAMGLPLAAVGLLGFAWAVYRHRRADVLVLSWLVLNFLLIGSWYIKFTRYILPLVPFLCIVGARFLLDLCESVTGRRARSAVVLVTAVVVLLTALYAVMFDAVYARPHSRTAAAAWVRENLPAGSLVVVDGASNVRIPTGEDDPSLSGYRFRLLDLVSLYTRNPPAGEREEYIRSVLDGADAVVLNEAYYRYYENAGEEYPVEKRFWEEMLGERLGFRLARRFKTYPHVGPLVLNDDSAEMSFAFSDHPAVFVFLPEKEPRDDRRIENP